MILPIILVPCLLSAGPERGVAPDGPVAGGGFPRAGAWEGVPARRLDRLPRRLVLGREVAVAADRRARLLGLSGLGREQAGAGLLIPRCASVHTFGMRFALDLLFLDRGGALLRERRGVPPRRLAWCLGAAAVLELPAGAGGENGPAGT